MMADLPDMSHLTPEERKIIENVMMRQKQEEERENEIMRRKQDEIQYLENTIRARSEQHKKAGVELDATCHICMKTKFADGIGHVCNYCDIRCCARCGGKVTLRSNKSIWVCILCRKKQELLSKTGQWMVKSGLGAADQAMLRRMQEDMQGGPPGLADLNQDKKPRLERAHSAAEKENLPLLQRSSSLLRRQYSQQEQIPPRRMSTSDSGVEMSVSPHSRSLPTPHVVVGSYPQQTPRHPAAFPEDDPNLYRGELDVLMRQHAQTYQRTRQIYQENSDISMGYPHTGVDTSRVHPTQQHSVHQVPGGHPSQQPGGAVTGSLHQQRSFSSSEEERSTPECASDEPDESEKGKGYYHGGGTTPMSTGTRRHGGGHHNGHHVTGSMTIEYNGHHPPREPRKEESTLVRRSFRRSGDEWRADSRRFTERRGKKTVRFDGGTNVAGGAQEDWSWEADRQGSQDSATKDSGIDTSSTFTSSEDSNRGDLPKQPLSWQESSDGQKMIGHMILRKSASGTSSILGLKVVGGKRLDDGRIGALIEKVKKGSTADVEGQLRPGDEVIEWNGHCLQNKSSEEVYDIIAASREESQVELYVSRNLSGPTSTPMMTGMPTTTMPMTTRRIAAQTQWRQKHEPMPISQQPHHKELYDVRRDKPSVLVTSPGSPDLHAQGRGRHPRQHQAGDPNVGGRLQVKLGYDPGGLQLIVTIVCATELRPRNNGQLRNAYARIYLLPDKSEATKKRTKNLPNTNDPRWNQTFFYNVRKSELKYKSLEVTVWDNVKYGANDFLGETIVELTYLNEKPQWYLLLAHDERRSHIGQYQEPSDDIAITPVDYHLSPPSTTSRLSDSDTSEYDITDGDVSQQRRGADGASISSIGSSSRFHNVPSNYKRHYSSPPPERDLCMDNEHRSRRDMSPQGRKRAALMISRDQPVSMSMSTYSPYRKDDMPRSMMGHRSHSAAPMDSPNLHYRGRSQSPTGHRSLSPPEHRSIPYSHGYMPTRFGSRSATATPTGSPKKRQLPQIPAKLHAALKERVAQDLEERARLMRHRNRQVHTTYRSTGMGGWERHYSGLSDSDLLSIGHDPQSLPHRMHRPKRGHLSPDKDVLRDFGDSDMESIASVASSAFSTQSERPRGSRTLIPTVKNVLNPSVISPLTQTPRRNRRRHKFRITSSASCSECHCQLNCNSCPTIMTQTTNPIKHHSNPTSSPYHPTLVRSKSAVVRSMHRKMRVPLTRSKTVDENLMRWSSPETSEHSGVIDHSQKFKKKGSIIPQIHVQECMIHRHEDTASLDRKFLKSRLKHYGEPKRLILEGRARSFEYNTAEDFYADGSERIGDFDLPRRAKSVDYEAVSNIFSDDSLRTARRKVKKNLSDSGDHLPSLKALSKSYYDSNGSSSIQTSETADPDEDPERKYYPQESALYPSALDQNAFDRVPSMGVDPLNYTDDCEYRNILKREDTNKRKYEAHLAEISRKSNRSQSPTSKAKTLEEHLYDLLENDHIYCSIDENNTDPCPCLIDPLDCNFDVVDTSSSRKSNFDDSVSVGRKTNETDEYNPRKSLRRRTKSTDSYLEDNYDEYKPYSSDYLHLDVDQDQHRLLPSHQEFHEEYRARSSSFPGKYDYYDNQEYTSHDRSPPARRRRRSTKTLISDYELQPHRTSRMNSLEVPTFSQSKRMMLERAESTPTLGPEEEEIEDSWELARRLSRRRRNSSCPEARDMRNVESSTAGREHQTESPTFFMGSDDDFGSVETVVCSDYRLSKNDVADDEQQRSHRFRPRYSSKDYADTKIQMRTDRSSSYPGPVTYETDDNDYKSRKTSCPECRVSDRHRNPLNSSDVEYEKHRPLAYQQQEHDRLKRFQQDRDQGNKRNVAISDTLEYYEYSMESESQCSENCGFGPYDTTTTLRPRNRAPRPGNANSNIFDSQTATSDTANYPRANVHHDTTTTPSSHHVKRDADVHRAVPRQRDNTSDTTGTQLAKNDNANNADTTGTINDNKRSDYSSPGSSYEKSSSRHPVAGDGHNGHPKRGQFTRSLSNADAPQDEKVDGSLSDTAVGLHVEEAARRTRKSSPGSKSGSGSSSGGGSAVQYQAGLGKKSNSTSQLSATECGVVGSGTDTRPSSGLTSRKRNSTPSSFQRSQEVVPSYQRLGATRQGGSVASDTAGSLNSISSSEASSWSPAMRTACEGDQLSEFIDGLGPGQLVGRQALGAPSFGDIQLSLKCTKGYLEVEVIRAKDLQLKQKTGNFPAPYVKMYLVKGRRCLEKQKTTIARQTREPFYQQSLAFKENFKGCFLQVSAWGDYCSLGVKKEFIGVAQIMLDDLNLSEMVFGWYKLFNTTSL